MGSKILFLITFGVIYPFFNVSGQNKTSGFEKDRWIKISVDTGMINKAKLLDNTELLDQYRDWIKVAAIKKMRFDESTNFRILYDYAPVRNEESADISNYNYGEGRYFVGPNETLYILIPYRSSSHDRLIGESADEYRKLTGKKPLAVKRLEYLIDSAGPALSFKYSADIDPNDIFSAKYGYVEATVSDTKSLTAFLNNIDDLVGASNQSNKVVLRGRKYSDNRRKNLDAEDVALLYKAEYSLSDNFSHKLKSQDWVALYDSYVKEQVQYLKTNYSQTVGSNSDAEMAEQIRLALPYNAFLQKNMADLKTQVGNYSPGFSLDWGVMYDKLSNALAKILRGDNLFVDSLLQQTFLDDSGIAKPEPELTMKPFDDWKTQELAKREKSFATFAGILSDQSTERENLYTWEKPVTGSRVGLSSDYIKAFQNNRQLIQAIISQINDKHASEKVRLDLYNSLMRYLSGEYNFNLTGEINSSWPLAKRLLYTKVSRDIGEIVRRMPTARTLGPLTDSSNSTIIKAILKETGQTSLTFADIVVFLKADTAKLTELGSMFVILDALKTKYQYQKARYVGSLQGTKIGMTLFYTDLLMKLWGFDFKNTTPNIPGFLSEINFKVSPFYSYENNKNPFTRFWLGPLSSAIRASDKGDQLYFSTYATKVYCASSNEVFPNEEVRANYIDRRYTNWWNKHYGLVADYEPEYHRLNQIMKWYTVLLWLKHSDQFLWLNDQKPLTRNLNFENWYNTNTTLKVKVELPFLSSKYTGEKTECLDLIHSKYVELYDRPYSLSDPKYSSFYGGVSLLTKSEMEANILKSGTRVTDELLDRTGLTVAEDMVNPEFHINEGKYDLKVTEHEVVIERVKPREHFQSKDLQEKNFGLARVISTAPRELHIKQSLHTAPDISSGGIKVSETDDAVLLRSDRNDVASYQDYIIQTKAKVEFNQFADESVQIDRDRTHFYVKMPNSDAYMVGRWGIKEEMLPIINEASASPHISLSSNGFIYYDLSLLSKEDFMATYMKDRWMTIDDGELVLTKHNVRNEQFLTYQLDGHTGKILFEEDQIFIKSSDPMADEALARSLEYSDISSIGKYAKNDRSEVYVLTKRGVSSISNKAGIFPTHENLINEFLPNAKGRIKCVVVDAGSKEIKLIDGYTLKVPELSSLTVEQKEILAYVNDRLRRDKLWFIKDRNISLNDVSTLRQLSDENDNLVSSYYWFSDISISDDNIAIADLQSKSAVPQCLIKTGGGIPQVVTIAGVGKQMDQIASDLTYMYEHSTDITYEELLKSTEPAAKVLKEISQSTAAKKIVTLEPKGLNSELINNLHKVSESQIFYKDQPDINKSEENAGVDVSIDFSHTEVLISFDLKDSGARELALIVDSLRSFGIHVRDKATTAELTESLNDSSITQLVVLARNNGYGLLLSDGTISETGLEFGLDFEINKKQLIYIISNKAEEVGYEIATRNSSSRVIMSNYTLGNSASLSAALNSLHALYSKAYQQAQTSPGASNSKYRPKDLNHLLKNVQEEQMIKLRSQKVKPIEFFKSIPNFKVYQATKIATSKYC